jgi:hypothetical protein
MHVSMHTTQAINTACDHDRQCCMSEYLQMLIHGWCFCSVQACSGSSIISAGAPAQVPAAFEPRGLQGKAPTAGEPASGHFACTKII